MKELRKDGRKYPYDAWLLWQPLQRCNFDCRYCFHYGDPAKKTSEIKKIDIGALMETLDKTGKTFRIHFAGKGEPFLIPNIIEVCEALTKKHYIGFNTNLTSPKIREFADVIDPGRVVDFDASCHIRELERHNLMDTYVENFLLLKEAGFQKTRGYAVAYPLKAEAVAYPPLAKEVEKYRSFFNKRGIELMFTYFMGTYNGKEYPASYTEKELDVFCLDRERLRTIYPYNKVCNAGFNAATVDSNGNVRPCFQMAESIGNIYTKIKFNDNLTICPFKLCGCPLKDLDPFLFGKANEEIDSAEWPGAVTRFTSFLKDRKMWRKGRTATFINRLTQ